MTLSAFFFSMEGKSAKKPTTGEGVEGANNSTNSGGGETAAPPAAGAAGEEGVAGAAPTGSANFF